MNKFTPMKVEVAEKESAGDVFVGGTVLLRSPIGTVASSMEQPEYAERREMLAWIAHACNNFDAMLEALRKCEIAMDAAALHDLPQQMPPSYRDSWASAHIAARDAIAAATRPAGESPDTRRVEGSDAP